MLELVLTALVWAASAAAGFHYDRHHHHHHGRPIL